MKSGFYDNRRRLAQWLDCEDAPKHFPKPNLHQKETMVTVWWSGATLIPYSFLNPSETTVSEEYAQQVNEMHQKLQHLQPILIKRMGLNRTSDSTSHNQRFKIINLGSFASFAVLTWPLANRLPLLQASQHFCREKGFHSQQEAENTFQEFLESWSTDFYATRINKLISHWQKCVDCNGSYFV